MTEVILANAALYLVLGDGDVLPVGHVAQSDAAFQAIAGTLYTVLLLSRVVGLHAAKP